MPAFGSIPGTTESGDAGIPIPPSPDQRDQQIVDDLDAIRDKYTGARTNQRVVLQFAANAGLRQDMTGQRVNSIILVGVTGVLFGYLTDQSPNFGKAAFLPDFAVSAGVVPTTVQIMVPPREDYVVSFQEGNNAAATGTARILYI